MEDSEDLTEGGSEEPRPRGFDLAPVTLAWALARKSLRYGSRKLRHGAERCRMNWIRHNPAVLTTALRSADKILVVCYGNIIRSAFAARLLVQAVGDHAAVAVSSCGLGATPGNAPPATAVCTATRLAVA